MSLDDEIEDLLRYEAVTAQGDAAFAAHKVNYLTSHTIQRMAQRQAAQKYAAARRAYARLLRFKELRRPPQQIRIHEMPSPPTFIPVPVDPRRHGMRW